MQPESINAKPISIGAAATLACLYEVTARKPGNVYPGADFDEKTTYAAFVKSAVVIGPILEKTPCCGVGQTVLEAVTATRDAVATNTNLGTLLLIALMAMVPRETKLSDGIGAILDALTPDDTRAVYQAIRLANAGGLGREDVADVRSEPPPELTLKEAMRLAAERDLVARQYVSDFEDVFFVASSIETCLARSGTLESSIIEAFLIQLQQKPDTLIQRKLGEFTAKEASFRAEGVLMSGGPTNAISQNAIDEFDRWLRADAHRRNPGTTADLVAAALFVLLREGRLDWKMW